MACLGPHSWGGEEPRHKSREATAPPPTSIQIQVGNFNQTIATLQLGGSETAIIVSIVICSVLLLLSVVGKEPFSHDAMPDLPHLVPAPLKTGTLEKRHDGRGTQLAQRPDVPWLQLTQAEEGRCWGMCCLQAAGPECLAQELGTLSSRH